MTDDTLDPPGRIAILGGGPVGIEAALYARYLGYGVVLFEADQLVHRLRGEPERPAPENATSPLGLAAVAAQRGLGGTSVELQLTTFEDWAREYFEPIAASDLLAGRVRTWTTVERLELAPPEEDEAEEDAEEEGPVPPDFLVHFRDAYGVQGVERVEAVIDARGAEAAWIGPGEEPPKQAGQTEQPAQTDQTVPAYLYRVGSRAAAETDYRGGLVQVRQLFATLWGRPGLDVYANLGGQV